MANPELYELQPSLICQAEPTSFSYTKDKAQ